MREPKPEANLYGLVAEFDDADKLVAATVKAHKSGFRCIEAYSPFPIAELSEALDFRDGTVPISCLVGGIAGAVTGVGMQAYAMWDFPINIGGRPAYSVETYALIVFELTVLGAVLTTVLTMLVKNRLPRLHHPLFELPHFHFASADKFFLVVQSNDPKFSPGRTRTFLEKLEPLRVDEVGFAEEPE